MVERQHVPAQWRPPPPTNHLVTTLLAPAVALSGEDGQIDGAGMDGLLVADVRVLTAARLALDGLPPHHLARFPEGPGRTRFVAVARTLGDPINDPTIRVDRVRRATSDGMRECIRVRSTATVPVRTALTISLGCDLTPLEVAKYGGAPVAVRVTTTNTPEAGLTWSSATVTVDLGAPGAEVHAEPAALTWSIELDPGEESTVEWWVRVSDRQPVLVAPTAPVEWVRPGLSTDDRLARLLHRSLDDLQCLRLTEAADPAGTFLGAGAPWFLTLFGRDSILSARMMLPLGTALAESTLRTLARRQGTGVDALSGEAPGKIMHELRPHDPRMAGRTTGGPATYYGTVDATLLWICLLAEAWRWGMPESAVTSLLPNLDRALSWLEQHGDPNGDGLVEYLDEGRGLANQGWKDSGNAIRFSDGGLGQPPIALCEVQGYAHRAALDAADLLDTFDPTGGAGGRWRAYAARLARTFRQRFWLDGPLGAFPALAIDGDGKPVDSLTSNIGHLLGTGLLDAAEEAVVARLLGAEPLAGGYGLRTMSTLDAGYAPLSYHCGSIWPHDTAVALLGLATAGADREAHVLLEGLLGAAEAFDYRLPELYGGDARTDVARPVPYPGACVPQAWSAAAAVSVLQALLGLAADVPRGEFRVRPLLPGLGAVEVQGLRVAGASVDVAVDREGAVTVSGLPPYLRLVGP